MKLIVYSQEDDSDSEELGEAKIIGSDKEKEKNWLHV